ncbi:MAG: hypothetical protein IT292_12475 [Deltaproteobacteria bacterium]|nr:hypothetical protein [Deltaproteobacteria bacterium]
MNVRKVVGFIFPIQTINFRNIVSLLLVALFIFVYWLSGGRIIRVNTKQIPSSAFGGGYYIPKKGEITIKGDIKTEEEVTPASKPSSTTENRDANKTKKDFEQLQQRFNKTK